jgi:uncharacterized membrane protein YphA (DoxX/SURF4 family)
METWERISTGIAELIASVLILIPATTGIGALSGLGIMGGALFFHLTELGIVVEGDHGQLFIYALIVFINCLFLTLSFREQLYGLIRAKRKSLPNSTNTCK